jgi:manganese/zinc/iron transport system substrate-binding protein
MFRQFEAHSRRASGRLPVARFSQAQRIPAILLAAATMCLSGCGETDGQSASGGKPAPSAPIAVVVTTGMIADAASIIGGERATVSALMGPGVDPHLYQPTARDQSRLSSARLILYNGLHLEGKMAEVFESLARKKACVAVTRGIPEERLLAWASSAGMHDPHVWFDVQLWRHVVTTIAAEYTRIDPDGKQYYERQARQYCEELDHLDQYCHDRAREIPTERRVLITSHDAFHYFGKAYGFEVVGLQGISTESEAGLKAITDAIDLIKRRKIRAIFPETSVPRAAIERVARDSGASLGPELYSDALGEPDSPAGTYAGMIRTNIDNIVDALK